MIFNSFPFVVFIIVVWGLFYFPFKNSIKWQNWLLLISSYFFYGYANIRLIPLLLFSTTIFFFLGKLVHKSSVEKRSSLLTTLGVIFGVGILFFFKYLNFFIESVNDLFNILNITPTHWRGLDIIMPIGISFFTFKLISYIVEISRGKIEPIDDFVAFSVYISFFPTIMSGPIDKPNTFLPQLKKYHNFNYNLAVDGCQQILWGVFQKIVIADNLAIYTNYAWNNIETVSGSTLLLAAILFSFQMYTDFSGYSDIAIGIGKVFGFRITKNFNYPFFATNIAEYWRRWHISLTSWLTDYVFMPLNIKFRNWSNIGMIVAIIINMVLVGIWHGANWTFAVFGLYHGVLFIPLIISGSFMKKRKLKQGKWGLPKFYDFMKMVSTFFWVTIGLVIFNSANVTQSIDFFKGIFNMSLFEMPYHSEMRNVIMAMIFTILFIIIEWKRRDKEFASQNIGINKSRFFRWSFYASIIFLIGMFAQTKESAFIYFQF